MVNPARKHKNICYPQGCTFCRLYRKGTCQGMLEANLLRQTSDGRYELYYPLRIFLERIAKVYMLSTNEVIEKLLDEYGLKIDRTLIFKYEREGLLEKKEKIGSGRARGVRTYWDDRTPRKISIIKAALKMNTDLKYIKMFHDLLYRWKHLELLKFCQEVKKTDSLSEDIIIHIGYKKEISGVPITSFDLTRLYVVANYFAEMEADIDYDYITSRLSISYDSKKPEEGYLSISFPEDQFTDVARKRKKIKYVKKVTFAPDGVQVEDLAG